MVGMGILCGELLGKRTESKEMLRLYRRALLFINYLIWNFVLLSIIRTNLHLQGLKARKEFNPSKSEHLHFLMQHVLQEMR